jgi:Uma2 family endonuclease
MSEPYEEILGGEIWLRMPPGGRHEQVCERLHVRVAGSLKGVSAIRLLPRRTIIQVKTGTLLRPDLALVESVTGKLWLAAEVISSEDHRPDTVTKKALYEEISLPRLWMVDPRYHNVEVYHAGAYGLALKTILAGQETLEEMLLPMLRLTMADLFAV